MRTLPPPISLPRSVLAESPVGYPGWWPRSQDRPGVLPEGPDSTRERSLYVDCNIRANGDTALTLSGRNQLPPRLPVANSDGCFFEISVPKASTVAKERMKNPREAHVACTRYWGLAAQWKL